MSQMPPPPGVPRWVKVLAAIFMLLVAIVVAMHLAGVDFGGNLHRMP